MAARLLAAVAATGHAPITVAIARARAALAENRPDAALEMLVPILADATLATSAAAGPAWHVQAQALHAGGHTAAACRSAATAASLHPCAEAIGLHAMLLIHCGRACHAATLLDTAIAAGPAAAGLHAALTVALLELGDPAAAAAAADRGLHTHPADPGLRHLRNLAHAA